MAYSDHRTRLRRWQRIPVDSYTSVKDRDPVSGSTASVASPDAGAPAGSHSAAERVEHAIADFQRGIDR